MLPGTEINLYLSRVIKFFVYVSLNIIMVRII